MQIADELVGMVTRVREGDTIEVRNVPFRIANLDCASVAPSAGDRATALIRQLASGASATFTLEGRRSYNREVGVCSISNIGVRRGKDDRRGSVRALVGVVSGAELIQGPRQRTGKLWSVLGPVASLSPRLGVAITHGRGEDAV